MVYDTLPDGELLLPVCILAEDIPPMLSALEMYRIMVNDKKPYPAFDAVLDAIGLIEANAGDASTSPCLDIVPSGTQFNCETFDTFNDVFDFYPNDPFTPLDKNDPNLYLEWVRWGNVLSLDFVPEWLQSLIDFFGSDFTGYEENDCLLIPNIITTLNPIQILDDILDTFTNFPLPTITMQFEGAGTIGIEFLNVPLGGRAIVLRDVDITLQEVYEVITDTVSQGNEGILNSVSIVELNRDLVSVPPETANAQIQEYEFTESDTNTIRIIFMPAFNDEIPFLFPFGGIRSVRVCEGISIKSVSTGEITNRYMTREGVIMSTVEDIRSGVHLGIYDVMKHAIAGHGDGSDSNIVNDVILGASGGVELDSKSSSSQSPDIVVADNREVVAGGAYGQSAKFRDLFADMNTYQPTYGEATVQSIVRFFLNPLEELVLDTLVSAYLLDNPSTSVDVDDLAEQIYCSGDFYTGVRNYALANHNEADLNRMIDFASTIPSTTVRDWYNLGLSQPSLAYEQYACTLRNTLNWTLDNNESDYTDLEFGIYANSGIRKLRLKVSGVYTDGTKFRDIAFKSDNGVDVIREDVFNFFLPTPNTRLEPPANIAYNPTHSYSWDVEIPDYAYTIGRFKLGALGFVDTGNELDVTIIDLGLI